MTIQDLIKDLIDTSRERLKTPISGAFLWSFLIFNWRPIVLLMFSSASIENRIIVINHEYCNFWAIFFPVFIALFYTILIPKLMLCIDKDLFHTKKERVEKKYDALEYLKDRHILIARKDYEQKSVESGSKEKQDFMDDIASLKETIRQKDESSKEIATSNKNNLDQLTESLKLSNSLLEAAESRETQNKQLVEQLEKDLKEARRQTYFGKEISSILSKLNVEMAKKFMDLKEEADGRLIFRLTSNRKASLQKFWALRLVEKITDDHYIFTDLGSTIYNILHLDNKLNYSEGSHNEVLVKHIRAAYKNLTPNQLKAFRVSVAVNGTVNTSKISVDEVNELADLELIAGSADTTEFVLTDLGRGVQQFILLNNYKNDDI